MKASDYLKEIATKFNPEERIEFTIKAINFLYSKGDEMVFNKRVSNSDIFYTPAWAVKILTDFINFKNTTVWECACGEGHISKILEEVGAAVIETDITTGRNFLSWTPEFHWNYIVTNPPFSIKDLFIERCFELGTPFCLLLPINALEGKKRQDMYLKNKMTLDVLIPNKRVSYIGSKNSPNFASAWFCFGIRKYSSNDNFQVHFVKAENV